MRQRRAAPVGGGQRPDGAKPHRCRPTLRTSWSLSVRTCRAQLVGQDQNVAALSRHDGLSTPLAFPMSRRGSSPRGFRCASGVEHVGSACRLPIPGRCREISQLTDRRPPPRRKGTPIHLDGVGGAGGGGRRSGDKSSVLGSSEPSATRGGLATACRHV